MTHPSGANDRIEGRHCQRTHPLRRFGLRIEAVAGLAAAFLASIGPLVETRHAQAQGEGPPGRSERPSDPSPRSKFIRRIYQELRALDQRLTDRLNRAHVLRGPGPRRDPFAISWSISESPRNRRRPIT